MPPRRSRRLTSAYEARIVSAHRTPDRLYAFAKGATGGRPQGHHRRRRRRGASARHGGGDDAAAGVRRAGRIARRWPASTRCYRSCRCRPAFRSARWRSASAGAINAALLAAAVLALHDTALAGRLDGLAQRQTEAVAGHARGRRRERAAAGHARPGATIGILGGGQLGRMLALAAAELGLNCHIYRAEPGFPAFDVVAAATIAAYDDATRSTAFAADRRRRHL